MAPGCEWCSTPKFIIYGCSSSGVSFPSGVGTVRIKQPVAFPGAPHSSTAICPVSAQKIMWYGRVIICSAMVLLPVPLNTNSASHGRANCFFTISVASTVHGSSPYPTACPSLALISASITLGCTLELLSDAKLLILFYLFIRKGILFHSNRTRNSQISSNFALSNL